MSGPQSCDREQSLKRGSEFLSVGNTRQLRVGFVSTRLAGTDGVSLETAKWADVLCEDGHEVFFMAGELDTPSDRSFLLCESNESGCRSLCRHSWRGTWNTPRIA
jgi:hypothetical protein